MNGGRGARDAMDPAAGFAGLREMPPICPDPVFVIGAPRSGTTVLARSLAEHSALWASGENDLLFLLFGNRAVERAFDRAAEAPGRRWVRLENVTRDEFLAYVGMGINALITSRSGGRRWVDHTPLNTWIAGTLADAFPGARFIHIVRDGREVVHSMLNFARAVPDPAVAQFLQERVPWAADMGSACVAWRDHVDAAMEFCDRHADRALIVRYEDLANAPEGTFEAIHSFLGVAEEPGPARFLASRRINSSFRDRPRASAGDVWEEWDAGKRQLFTELAGTTMLRCGYPMSRALGSRHRAASAGDGPGA